MSAPLRDKIVVGIVVGIVSCSLSGITAYGFGARSISGAALEKMNRNEIIAEDTREQVSSVKGDLGHKMSKAEFADWERQHAAWAQTVIDKLSAEDAHTVNDVKEMKALLIQLNNNVQKLLGRMDRTIKPTP